MTDTQVKSMHDLQLAFREQLKELVLEQYEQAQKTGLGASAAAAMVAEECMHMATFFITRGSAWDADHFVQECRNMFEFHKNKAAFDNKRAN